MFECDHLNNLCSSIQTHDIYEQTDTLLEVRLGDLDSWYNRLQANYEILMVSQVSSSDGNLKENCKLNFNACSETYYVARSHMLDMIRLSEGYNAPADRSRLAATQPIYSRHSLPLQSSNDTSGFLKVPPCDTEVFEGGYEQWPSFRDMFTSVYGNHPKLSRAQKLYHLRNKTRGIAGAIVKRYSLCDENFDLA